MAGKVTPSADNAPSAPRSRRSPRQLTLLQSWVRVPLGLLWLALLTLIAVPVVIYMTLLYFATQSLKSPFKPRASVRSPEGKSGGPTA